MDKTSKHITQLFEDSLRNVVNEANNGYVDDSKIHFKRVVFNADYNLVVVEITQNQWRGLYKELFESNTIKQALLSYSNCSKVDVVELDESTFIYFWTAINEHCEKARKLNLAYAV